MGKEDKIEEMSTVKSYSIKIRNVVKVENLAKKRKVKLSKIVNEAIEKL